MFSPRSFEDIKNIKKQKITEPQKNLMPDSINFSSAKQADAEFLFTNPINIKYQYILARFVLYLFCCHYLFLIICILSLKINFAKGRLEKG